MQSQAMTCFVAYNPAFLLIFYPVSGVFSPIGVKMRRLGGHARMMSARQTIVAASDAAKKINVMTQAAANHTGDGASLPDTAGPAIGGVTGGGAEMTGSTGSGKAASVSGSVSIASRTGTHSPPHRTHRTFLCGGRREAGTSYSAAQLGQAIRIDIHYPNVQISVGLTRRGAKQFQRPAP